MKLLLVALALIASTPAFAAGRCANYAKYGAIRAYISSVPGVEGNAVTATAKLVGTSRGAEKYDVGVESPCNVDGDDSNCNADYIVVVKPAGEKCAVVSVKEVK